MSYQDEMSDEFAERLTPWQQAMSAMQEDEVFHARGKTERQLLREDIETAGLIIKEPVKEGE